MGEKSWMKNVVFFKDVKKIDEALNYFDIDAFAGKNVPVKIHMGEDKNKYFIKPDFVRFVISKLRKHHINPYLFDTTVAYSGMRSSKKGYKRLAIKHGFDYKNIDCDIIIDDSGIIRKIGNRNFEVAKHLVQSTHIFALTHVKGHIATGMGGAIKNFGMGGVTKETKKWMHHGSRPFFDREKCTYCSICSEICPFDAIQVKEDHWNQNMDSCFGCGVCVENCNTGALTYDEADLQYLLACAAKACVQDKHGLYLNELKRISKSCDCDPSAGPIICPDIGFLISNDLVAIDKASIDLINQIKDDIFKKINKVNPFKQIKYGDEIGLGSSSYRLIEL